MKNLIINIFLLIPLIGLAQINTTNPPIQIVEICNGTLSAFDAPEHTYFKDVSNTFDKYLGTWKYESGDDIVIFEIVKVTQKYEDELKIFEDYLVGNYNYSNNGGSTFIINSIPTSINEEIENNALYSNCQDDSNQITFTFKDLLINKSKTCNIIFKFLPGSLTEMQVSINKKDCVYGTLGDQEPYIQGFSIPTNMVVVKQ